MSREEEQPGGNYKKYVASIQVTRTPVESIKTPLFIPKANALMREILTSHSAEIAEGEKGEYLIITFPEGTYREEVYLRTLDVKYNIIFPDGYRMFESTRRGSSLSYLRLYTEHLTEKQRIRLEEIARGEE